MSKGKMIFLGVTLLPFLIISCTEAGLVYEETKEIPEGKWSWKDTLSFEFEIQDVSKTYDIYYVISNSIEYPFQNLYVTYYIENEKKEVVDKLLQNITLMDAKTGKPFGESAWFDDNYTNQPIALKAMKFPKAGKYTFKIQQYMRLNTLPEIQKFGIKIVATPKSKS